jgi:outer membrane protein TolC
MNRGLLEVAEKKYKLSGQQYFFASHRFKLGIITTLELTTANKDFLQAKQNYMSVLKDLFINYYKIRHISLHDFTEDKDLMELFQISF